MYNVYAWWNLPYNDKRIFYRAANLWKLKSVIRMLKNRNLGQKSVISSMASATSRKWHGIKRCIVVATHKASVHTHRTRRCSNACSSGVASLEVSAKRRRDLLCAFGQIHTPCYRYFSLQYCKYRILFAVYPIKSSGFPIQGSNTNATPRSTKKSRDRHGHVKLEAILVYPLATALVRTCNGFPPAKHTRFAFSCVRLAMCLVCTTELNNTLDTAHSQPRGNRYLRMRGYVNIETCTCV